MSRTALLFAGQGAQSVGVGKDLADKFPTARALFDRANAALGYDLADICFKGPEPELTKTENAQPGIYLVSWVAFQLLKERVPSLKFEAAAGLSLGEFTALTAAGALNFEDGLRSEEHTSELQSQSNLVCRLLLEKKKDDLLVRPALKHRTNRPLQHAAAPRRASDDDLCSGRNLGIRSCTHANSPFRYMSSAFNTSAPAAPRMVLWLSTRNL